MVIELFVKYSNTPVTSSTAMDNDISVGQYAGRLNFYDNSNTVLKD